MNPIALQGNRADRLTGTDERQAYFHLDRMIPPVQLVAMNDKTMNENTEVAQTEPVANQRIQHVKITLSDGSEGVFTGMCLLEQSSDELTVSDILFSSPEEIPEGFVLGFIKTNEEEQ
jgi:hypothetical protein